MSSLVKLISEQNELMEMILSAEGEITPEMEAVLANLQVDVPAKVDGYYLVVDRLEIDEEYFKRKAEQFYQAAKQMAGARQRIKDHLKYLMETNKLVEIQGLDYVFKLSKSKPTVKIQNEDLIPKEYTKQVVTVQIEKERIREDLSLGIPVEGASLVESFSLRSGINKKVTKK